MRVISENNGIVQDKNDMVDCQCSSTKPAILERLYCDASKPEWVGIYGNLAIGVGNENQK